jgi:hypothetical protein
MSKQDRKRRRYHNFEQIRGDWVIGLEMDQRNGQCLRYCRSSMIVVYESLVDVM